MGLKFGMVWGNIIPFLEVGFKLSQYCEHNEPAEFALAGRLDGENLNLVYFNISSIGK